MKLLKLRITAGVILIWWIPVALIATAVLWWGQFSATIPTRWGADGPIEFAPLWSVVVIEIGGCVAFSAIATIGMIGSMSFRGIWVSAGAAAMLGGAWIFVASAGLSGSTTSQVTPWALTVPLFLLYGFLPALASGRGVQTRTTNNGW